MRSTTSQSGFTLVEMIVSLAVFSVVVTISVGALLVLISSNKQLQDEQAVMTNLAFALDSMTREIRTGISYYCDEESDYSGSLNIFADGNNLDSLLGDSTNDCASGRTLDIQGVSFIESGDSISGVGNDRIVYFFDGTSDPDKGHKIYRRIGSGSPQPIVSSGIYIEDAEFFVTNSGSIAGGIDAVQPMVTIFITAKESEGADKVYNVQTTVTQRTLDI